jgi:hypothetical protein
LRLVCQGDWWVSLVEYCSCTNLQCICL